MDRIKPLLIFITLVLSLKSFSQEKLYYFTNADSSLVGVRAVSGKVIIPLQFPMIGYYDLEEPITSAFVEFFYAYPDTTTDPMNPNQAVGRVYDRTGNFIYTPFLYDNGPDYWQEGIRRYVSNGKVGYVDLNNTILTEAKTGFAKMFNYGYAAFYEGAVTKVYEPGGEHWTVSPTDNKGKHYLINRKGEKVHGRKKPTSTKDYYYGELYYPYPFQYTVAEEKILNGLNQFAAISKVDKLLSGDQSQLSPIQFEIIGRPSAYTPYYTIQGYKEQQADDNWVIEATTNGQYFYSRYGERTALSQWIDEQLTKE
ncbi:hypothetical protein BWD42_00835 [Sphingobacterium sp. CZ-UAM]|uniref:hypothetical protein n=1 Tax=Sphingobacterium sp. CZ-UAM TaxID=1933868 RepID=UPI0009851BC5|nr:hypothetical protein [Sphingobacterium sp. CZ-UAM]OOG18561.1 hypothetical protein BWD42_00835 [Sphingobacterium sp. CZ-UAM]